MVTADSSAAGCPSCGVISTSVKESVTTAPRDLPYGETRISVLWHKVRWRCREVACSRTSFTESIAEVPAGRRTTGRLRRAIASAVGDAARSVAEVADAFGVKWPTVHAAFAEHANARLGEPELTPVLGIDETRRGKPRRARDTDTGQWSRLDPHPRPAAERDDRGRPLPHRQTRRRHPHQGPPPGHLGSARSSRPRSRQLHSGITYKQSPIERVDIEANEVHLSDGTTLGYEVLIVATGAVLAPEETDGLTGPGWMERVFTFYTPEGAAALEEALSAFEGGRVVLNVIDMPIKCPVAPLEFCFLADWYLTERETISPVIWCPMIRGNSADILPVLMCWIVKPEPQAMTRTTASPVPATGSGTWVNSNGVSGSFRTIAFMEIASCLRTESVQEHEVCCLDKKRAVDAV